MKSIFVLIVLFLFALPVFSQDTCTMPDLAEGICADLGPGEICFGQEAVELLVNCEFAPEFDTPDDRIGVEVVCLLHTSESGMALMNLQPDEHGVFIAAVGDVEMQNVSSGAVGTEVILEADTEIYSGPGSQYEVIGSLPTGTEIFVNACNCTRNWLRIMQADGHVAWIPSRRVNLDQSELPEVAVDTPIYENMQAFTLVTEGDCSGLLIQMADEPVLLQINGVMFDLDSTAFVRAAAGEMMEIDILEGQGRITVNEQTTYAPAGGHVLIPLAESNIPSGEAVIELYQIEHIANLPLELLPRSIDPLTALDTTHPIVVSVEECNVISDLGEMACPIQFINPDGDAIVRMDVDFVYAATGEWEGSSHESPVLLQGDMSVGTLGWDISCSLAGENFIGPVEWIIILEDAGGNRSAPFRAAFNCVDG